jgi:hypothetical protein
MTNWLTGRPFPLVHQETKALSLLFCSLHAPTPLARRYATIHPPLAIQKRSVPTVPSVTSVTLQYKKGLSLQSLSSLLSLCNTKKTCPYSPFRHFCHFAIQKRLVPTVPFVTSGTLQYKKRLIPTMQAIYLTFRYSAGMLINSS